MTRQCPHGRYASTRTEECLEEPPAIRWCTDEIQGKLAKGHPFDAGATIDNQRLAQLMPSAGSANIDQSPQSGLTKVEHITRCG
jgi:hypothetical protein